MIILEQDTARKEGTTAVTERLVFRLPQGQHAIGRKGKPVTIPTKALSREHAVVEVTPEWGVRVWDTNSSYGTFVGENQIKEPVDVSFGSVVRFGPPSSKAVFTLRRENLTFWGPQRAAVLGVLTDEWPTMVIGGETAAALRCVLRDIPVVDESWLDEALKREDMSEPLPKPGKHLVDLPTAAELRDKAATAFSKRGVISKDEGHLEKLLKDLGVVVSRSPDDMEFVASLQEHDEFPKIDALHALLTGELVNAVKQRKKRTKADDDDDDETTLDEEENNEPLPQESDWMSSKVPEEEVAKPQDIVQEARTQFEKDNAFDDKPDHEAETEYADLVVEPQRRPLTQPSYEGRRDFRLFKKNLVLHPGSNAITDMVAVAAADTSTELKRAFLENQEDEDIDDEPRAPKKKRR